MKGCYFGVHFFQGWSAPSLCFSDSKPEFSQLQIYSLLFCFNPCYFFNIPTLSSGPGMVNAPFFVFLQNPWESFTCHSTQLSALKLSVYQSLLPDHKLLHDMAYTYIIFVQDTNTSVTKCARVWKLQRVLNRYCFSEPVTLSGGKKQGEGGSGRERNQVTGWLVQLSN